MGPIALSSLHTLSDANKLFVPNQSRGGGRIEIDGPNRKSFYIIRIKFMSHFKSIRALAFAGMMSIMILKRLLKIFVLKKEP